MTIKVLVYTSNKDLAQWVHDIAELLTGLIGDKGSYLYVSVTDQDPTKRDC